MQIRIRFDGVSQVSHERIHEHISRWCETHLESLLSGFGYAQGQLAVVISRRAKGGQPFRVKLHMHLPPRKVLAVHARADDLMAAVDEALDRLLKQTQRHIAHVRHEAEYKRRARRARLHALKAEAAELPEADQQSFAARLENVLPRLREAIHRELVYLQNQGDLLPGNPSEDDVLDEVVAEARAGWSRGLDDDGLYRRLLKAMHKVLEQEVAARRQEEGMESLESTVPPDAMDTAEAMVEEEVHEFWQPDEVLHLEDVIEDPNAESPDELAEERRRTTVRLLGDLPVRWRRALMLHEFDKASEEEIAEMLDRQVVEIRAWIDAANAYLVARLEDAGFAPAEGRPLADIHLHRQTDVADTADQAD